MRISGRNAELIFLPGIAEADKLYTGISAKGASCAIRIVFPVWTKRAQICCARPN
jgi:hypothetical protein